MSQQTATISLAGQPDTERPLRHDVLHGPVRWKRTDRPVEPVKGFGRLVEWFAHRRWSDHRA
jgi:hypothetical protein